MTNTLKYSLGALGFIILLFLYNHNSQKSHTVAGEAIYIGQRENVARIVISENEKLIELVKKDTTWSITQADSLLIKENQIDKVFDRLLIVEQEMLMSSKEEKWEKFGVDDSLGRHLQIFDENDKELIHFVFGNSGQDYQHNYIREHKSPDVYRTNDNVYFLLNSNVTYWGSKPPKPEPEDKKEEN
jgi:hypothetical protein